MKENADVKLKNAIDKKFRTTYIGAIYAIEKAFNIVWDKEADQYVLADNTVNGSLKLSTEFLDMFTDIRDEILDIGNTQCRNLKSELGEYFEIRPKMYHTEFRIIGE